MTTQHSQLSLPKYRLDIDGLRAVAVLAVVAFHAFPSWVRGGFIGVDVFFVISGFLISTIIFENLDKGTFSFYDFYARRIRRIFPALLLVSLACFAFAWFELLADEFKQLGKHIAAGAGFISNFVLWNEAGYFDNSADTKPLLHLWSLGIEEQFYIIWPLVIWLSWKYKFNFFIIALTTAILSFGLNIKGVHADPVGTFYSPQTRFWELVIGSLLAWLAIYKKQVISNIKKTVDTWISSVAYNKKQELNENSLVNVLSLVGFSLLIGGMWGIHKDLSFPGGFALVPVAVSAFIIAAGSNAYLNRKILSTRIMVWFGLISFPLYLWHWPLLAFARIIEGETPRIGIRVTVVAVSVLLAWFTYRLVERPVRSGGQSKVKVGSLFFLTVIIGYMGYNTYERDGLPFRLDNLTNENILIKRKGIDSVLTSLSWYKGKDDWLFLGDNSDRGVSKLKLSFNPEESQIALNKELFSSIAAAGAKSNTKVVLFIGPDKSSIYPEYLPDEIIPSTKKYLNFFMDALHGVPNLTVYNPSEDLIRAKKTEGTLYWMTDTHWNNKGAFLAYSGFSKLLNLPIPEVEFIPSSVTHSGDLVEISNLKDFPLHKIDNWDAIWKNKPTIVEQEIADEQKTSFGNATVVTNEHSLSNMYVWVSGDSFSGGLRQYLNATFKEVRYVGHWGGKLKDLPADLLGAYRKPDMIIIVRVERSF